MLLTDEQIKALIVDTFFDREMWEYGKEYLDRIAKAQLKQVVEWLDSPCSHDLGWLQRFSCPLCRGSLLDEVKDAAE